MIAEYIIVHAEAEKRYIKDNLKIHLIFSSTRPPKLGESEMVGVSLHIYTLLYLCKLKTCNKTAKSAVQQVKTKFKVQDHY